MNCLKCKDRGKVRQYNRGSGRANLTYFTVPCDCPAVLTWIAKDKRVSGVETEEDNGYWIFVKRGFTADPKDAHDIHEMNIPDLLVRFHGIEPCECESCK